MGADGSLAQEKEGQFRRYHLNTSVVEDVMLWLGKLIVAKDESPTQIDKL